MKISFIQKKFLPQRIKAWINHQKQIRWEATWSENFAKSDRTPRQNQNIQKQIKQTLTNKSTKNNLLLDNDCSDNNNHHQNLSQ